MEASLEAKGARTIPAKVFATITKRGQRRSNVQAASLGAANVAQIGTIATAIFAGKPMVA